MKRRKAIILALLAIALLTAATALLVTAAGFVINAGDRDSVATSAQGRAQFERAGNLALGLTGVADLLLGLLVLKAGWIPQRMPVVPRFVIILIAVGFVTWLLAIVSLVGMVGPIAEIEPYLRRWILGAV